MTAGPEILTHLDHVQLALPPGGEEVARSFYAGLLGLPEAAKPPVLAAWGGVWFRRRAVEVHLGVEAEFRPARKAHPAFRGSDLDRRRERLRGAGVEVIDDDNLPDERRFYAADTFGNRLEFMAERASQAN